MARNTDIDAYTQLFKNDKSGRANFVAPATSTYDYSIECIFHKRKSQLSIDLVWPSTSNSALSNLLCFVVSLTDMLFIYSIVLFIYSTTGWSRASTLYVRIQAGNRYRKPVQHSIAKVLRFTAKK